MISIMKPAVNEIQAKPTTGAVDKYVIKFCITGGRVYFLRICNVSTKPNTRTNV